MKYYSNKEVAKMVGRSYQAVGQYAERHKIAKNSWSMRAINIYKAKGEHKPNYISDDDLSPHLLAIRNKYKKGVPDDEVFALANSIENELFVAI